VLSLASPQRVKARDGAHCPLTGEWCGGRMQDDHGGLEGWHAAAPARTDGRLRSPCECSNNRPTPPHSAQRRFDRCECVAVARRPVGCLARARLSRCLSRSRRYVAAVPPPQNARSHSEKLEPKAGRPRVEERGLAYKGGCRAAASGELCHGVRQSNLLQNFQHASLSSLESCLRITRGMVSWAVARQLHSPEANGSASSRRRAQAGTMP
jgi:hypothetical protein